MAKRKQEEAKKGLDEWMGTYGDMVTLLLCFFVLLFASSTIDADKFQTIAASFSSPTLEIIQSGGSSGVSQMLGSGILEMPDVDESIQESKENFAETQKELKQMVSDFKTYFADNNLDNSIGIKTSEDSITLEFKDGILFDKAKAQLRPDAINLLAMVADELLKHPDNNIMVEGHTDSDPIGNPQFPSNFHLSSNRAISVVQFFQDVKGIDPSRLTPVGRGEFRPVAPNDTLENKAKNRRVEIKIMSKYYSDSEK